MTRGGAVLDAPGPQGRDMLRAIGRIRSDAPGFLAACRARYGDVVAFPIPRSPVLFVNDPDAVRRVLQDNHRAYDKATVQYRSLAAVSGQGLLTNDGASWLRQRRLVQPAFHAATLADVAAHTAEAAGRLVERWDAVIAGGGDGAVVEPGDAAAAGDGDGAVTDVDEAMMHATLDVVGHALFGTDLGDASAGGGSGDASAGADRLVRAVLDALDVVVARARNPLAAPPWLPTPGTRKLRRSLRTLDATVAAMVAQRRARDAAGEPPTGDLLDLLLAARDGDTAMDDRALRDEVVTLIIAGHETVASALTWTWHLLAADPEATARLHAELDGVLGTGTGARLPAYDDLPALPWTRAVVEESLRLYPPAWVITRRALEPDRLAGHAVPAGTLVIVSPWVLHRHEGVWARPEAFDPGRFLPERRDEVPRHAYIPFGAGPRLCIGREFALVEATLLLAALAARYAVSRVWGATVRPDALVTVRPHGGLPMHLHRRA